MRNSYNFLRRFDCSPQEWQRNFLLVSARQLLTGICYKGSVKSLTCDLGFTPPGSFASHCRQRLGERPSLSRAVPPGGGSTRAGSQ